MDFWSRLIGGATKQSQKQKHPSSAAHTPQQRLQRFRRAYSPIYQLSSRPNITAANGPALEQLRISLQRIAAILREETRTPAPHMCLSFAASAQIYSVIARAASTSQNEAVIREATAVFGILVDCEEEGFLASSVFSKSLIRFIVRVTTSITLSIGDDTETDLIEILFGVAAKLRSQPDILPIWFRPTARPPPEDQTLEPDRKNFAGTTQKDNFPLCYLLIDRIHHEGRIGDFARTGLLYVFEAVSYSPELEDWIIASDLPTLMASGLGALYSQLSRELSIRHENERLPLMLAMSDYADTQPPATAENIFSTSHANHVSTFLSHLAFWQDVLEHCGSDNVKQTLLDHFQLLFLQQLLYPSLLQSSDTDGGSSVAVLTYVANTLEALDHPDLVHMILRYLLAMQDSTPYTLHPEQSPSSLAAKRQSSLFLLNGPPTDEEQVDPNLFSLVDLILNGIRSRNPQTAVAALKLSSVLLNRHTGYAISSLVKVDLPSSTTDQRTAGALSAESDALMTIAAGLSYEESLDDAYATALQDITPSLEIQLVQRFSNKTGSVLDQKPVLHPLLNLASNDPFLSAIGSLFQSFFTNSVDVNLSLTEALIQLTLRTQISLEGWLVAPPSSYRFNDDEYVDPTADMDYIDEEERAALRRLQNAHRRPNLEGDALPMIPSLLRRLQSQIDAIRGSISNIDALIAKRIEILSGIEKDEPTSRPASLTPSRMSSDVGVDSVRSYRVGEPRQVQRLKSASAVPSRLSSPKSSQSLRSVASSSAPSLDSSAKDAPNSTSGRLSRGIFQPPPPDEGSVSGDIPGAGIASGGYEFEAETLRRKLLFRRPADSRAEVFQYVPQRATIQQADQEYEEREASASHVLTNIVVLHFFLLELVAVLQTRAVMFGEVVFS